MDAAAPIRNDRDAEAADLAARLDARGSCGGFSARSGGVDVEVRTCSRPQASQAALLQGAVLLIAPLRGKVEITGELFDAAIDVGSAALLAKPGAYRIVWGEGASGALLHLSRNGLQAVASRRFEEPVRLTATNRCLDRDGAEGGFDAALNRLLAHACGAANSNEPEPRQRGGIEQEVFLDRLVAALERQGLRRDAFQVARSVKRAMDRVNEWGGSCDENSLAAMAGVTVRTLRSSFRECLGVPLSAFVQRTQLETVKRRLASGYDSRPIPAIAEAAGFTSVSGFSRAYLRCFGETPTQTRVRAVRSKTWSDRT